MSSLLDIKNLSNVEMDIYFQMSLCKESKVIVKGSINFWNQVAAENRLFLASNQDGLVVTHPPRRSEQSAAGGLL